MCQRTNDQRASASESIDDNLCDKEDTEDVNVAKVKKFRYISAEDANKVLLSLKKPIIITFKKEAFTTTFKMFHIIFARHCALMSCIPPASRGSITMKSLTVVLDAILQYYFIPQKDECDDDNLKGGKKFYDTYSANMKVICDNVSIGSETLLNVVEPTNFFYKPSKVIRVIS